MDQIELKLTKTLLSLINLINNPDNKVTIEAVKESCKLDQNQLNLINYYVK